MIDEIRRKFESVAYEYSLHAVDQSILRRVSRYEVEEAIGQGQIIEDYPSDKYGPSCLIFGLTSGGRPIHVQCTHPAEYKIKIITVYEPDSKQWVDFKVRRIQ